MLLPKLLEDVKETVNVPGVVQTTEGFCNVDVDGVPPTKLQAQVVGVGEEISVNVALLF